MLALLSVWTGLAALGLSMLMWLRPAWFTDIWLTVSLYTAIFSMTFAGLTLWDLRKQPGDDPAVAARRVQSKVGIGFSLAGIAIVYFLVDRLAGAGK